MEDFEKMKVLDANAVPHNEESAESSGDDSSERSYVQVTHSVTFTACQVDR